MVLYTAVSIMLYLVICCIAGLSSVTGSLSGKVHVCTGSSPPRSAAKFCVKDQSFYPRGANYIRLNFISAGHHSTFSPLYYDRQQARSALTNMAGAGYNLVRVFIDSGDSVRTDSVAGINTSDPTTILGARYMDNFAGTAQPFFSYLSWS